MRVSAAFISSEIANVNVFLRQLLPRASRLEKEPLESVPMQSDTSAGDSRMQPAKGLIAILDALGAAVYSREEAAEFLKSRDLVITITGEK
jgi:hypothetical protein